VLKRFEYRRLERLERGVVLEYLRRMSHYSRAQLPRQAARRGSIPVAHWYNLRGSARHCLALNKPASCSYLL
jgi:hypothetical protein